MSARTVDVYLVQAFTDSKEGGNAAGVVLDADRYNRDERQAIAAKAGYSETAFVTSSETADLHLDFYTPNKPIPYCGHATIGAISFLRQQGLITGDALTNETPDGVMKITFENDTVFMQLQPPVFEKLPDLQVAALYDSLGITTREMIEDTPPEIVSAGVRFAVIGVRNEDILRRLRPELSTIKNISDSYDLIGYYVFTPQTGAYHATCRMFGPRYAIDEESATGMGAGALGCYLQRRMNVDGATIRLQQGKFMAEPSLSEITVQLDVDGSKIVGVRVGGKAVMRRKLTLTI